MAIPHGNRKYYQILMPPNQAALFEELAAERGIKTTALMRELLCNQLKVLAPAKAEAATEFDKRLWQQSVANRIEGRRKARLQREAETNHGIVAE